MQNLLYLDWFPPTRPARASDAPSIRFGQARAPASLLLLPTKRLDELSHGYCGAKLSEVDHIICMRVLLQRRGPCRVLVDPGKDPQGRESFLVLTMKVFQGSRRWPRVPSLTCLLLSCRDSGVGAGEPCLFCLVRKLGSARAPRSATVEY